MNLIDTHTHLFGEQFDADRPGMIQRALEAGVEWMLLPNIDSQTIDAVVSTVQGFPSTKAMWGLHPCHVFANWEEELAKIELLFESSPAVAVGEIGLDFYWSKDFVEEQKQALNHQMQWALDRKLPVSLHTREATQETIELVKPFANKGLTGVFHCFSGYEAEANAITELGFALGIGGSITYKKNPIREFLPRISLKSIVLETDSPYLPPVPYRGKRNESAYVKEVALEVASLCGTSLEEVARITTENAKMIFKLNS